jgi:methionyl-tRNA synthetase
VHFIGKDNIVFHCIIFPTILKAEGSYILPDNVPANEFLNLEGNKISTSRNWAVWLHEYLEDFPGKQDVLRYVLCANAPETKDNDFTWKDFQARNNNELVAILGNFINRTLVLTHKYFDGKVPEAGMLFDIDDEVVDAMSKAPRMISDALEQFRFREALNEYIGLARAGNKYLAETEPWKEIRENPERVGTILNLALQVTANLAILGSPFLPFSMEKLREMVNLETMDWERSGETDLLPTGHTINKPELMFEKIEDDVIQRQIDKLHATRKDNEKEVMTNPIRPEISFDDFVKLDMRVGTILHAEKLKKSRKLLKLTVDIGTEKRTVLSGIAEQFSPESVVGKQVTLLANLAPRKIMGIMSEGMILMAEDEEGKLTFLMPSDNTSNGSQVS